MKHILKLARHSRTCQTSEKLSWTFEACKIFQDLPNFRKVFLDLLWQSRRLLKIIETYLEACKTFQNMPNFSKVILDLLAIQETFKNHRKLFRSFQDISDLAKLQENVLDLLAIQKTFKNHRKIFWSFQDIPGLVKLQERYFWPSGNPKGF